MTLTTHAAIGAFIGSFVSDPVIGFMAGATSHFLVDMIPHGDNQLADLFRVYKRRKLAVTYVMIDAIIAILFLLVMFSARSGDMNTAFSAAIAGSILPDLLVGLSDATQWKPLKRFSKFHFYFHDFFSRKHGDVKLKYALVGQVGFIIVLLNLI
ncbi:MAG: hypothetical protein NUV56_04465 [Candidatus Uhrbacteria bacterium]|nr:hypothetical protein [Candidatus Uhrbacteria bacterium]